MNNNKNNNETKEAIKELLQNSNELLDINNLLNDVENKIYNEIDEIDDLYTELKSHYDEVKQPTDSEPLDMNAGFGNVNKRAKPLSFLHQQASNLIAAKKVKSDLLKQITDVEIKKIDLTHKQIMLVKKNVASVDDNSEALALNLFNLIQKSTQVENVNEHVDLDEENDESIDSLIDENI